MEQEFRVCPYNNSHIIIRHRMPSHLVKCVKSYKGPPLERCVYNATHLIRQGEMNSHLEECRDAHLFQNDQFLREAENCRRK